MFGLSPSHLILLLVIVLVVFGTKKLRNVGSDLGGALRDFKRGLNGSDESQEKQQLKADPPPAGTESTSNKSERVD